MAEEEIKKSLMLILSQYEFTMAPYPGQITAATNCGTTYRPKMFQKDGLSYLRTYANDRMALSICNSDEYKYVLTTSYFLNKENKSLLIVDFYQGHHKDDEKEIRLLRENFNNFRNVDLQTFKNILK